jgi:glycosyltransferase involved in cell wall biosynthesis
MSPEKRPDRAIELALQSGFDLKIGAKIYPEERAYFETIIKPLLIQAGPRVEFLGEVGGREKDQLLREARALLFPIDWEEPFGLVMIEALACGTPVIGWNRGSVPEVIDNGISGFVVNSMQEALHAINCLDRISRSRCRQIFEERFLASRMARDYVEVYRSLQRKKQAWKGMHGLHG